MERSCPYFLMAINNIPINWNVFEKAVVEHDEIIFKRVK